MVVHGLDGTDEISLCAPTRVAELRRGAGGSTEIVEYTLDPREIGIPLVDQSALIGGGAKENALTALRVLEGSALASDGRGTGWAGAGAFDPGADAAVADAACLNAGAALFLYGLSGTVGEGYALAKKAVESGAAREKLERILEEGKRISAVGAASEADAAREGDVR
jgi:anthranilate phosphoribosyltransferase